MPRISAILLQDKASGMTLAQREDGHYIVGLCLTKGSEHRMLEHVDYYIGNNFDEAKSHFDRMSAPHKDVDTLDE